MFDLNALINDGNIWLALIAINMTIIGLTSLAETKRIIGIDYGKFLIRSYVVFGPVQMYHLLIVFAIVNAFSLFSMFVQIPWVRVVNFAILVMSLVFAIYYFFRYILVENDDVREQIYKHELLGLYYKSPDETTLECDLLARIKPGWRSSKMLSTNVIEYFNSFNTESYDAFVQLFGPNSILYSNEPKVLKYWKDKFGLEPFDYTRCNENFVHISHEYFQIFRYTELQVKWTHEIIKLFNGSYSDKCPGLRLDNIMRIFTHINRFGNCRNLYSYKFIEYCQPCVLKAFENDELITGEDGFRAKKELCTIRQLAKYTFKTIDMRGEDVFYTIARDMFTDLLTNQKYAAFTTSVEKLREIVGVYNGKSEMSQEFLSELVLRYLRANSLNESDIPSLNLPLLKGYEDDQAIQNVRNNLFSI